jgi:hypothetical protein
MTDTQHNPIVDARNLEVDAQAFLSSGSTETAQKFLDELQSIAGAGQDYVNTVFRQAVADNSIWNTLPSAKLSDDGNILFERAFTLGQFFHMSPDGMAAGVFDGRAVMSGRGGEKQDDITLAE